MTANELLEKYKGSRLVKNEEFNLIVSSYNVRNGRRYEFKFRYDDRTEEFVVVAKDGDVKDFRHYVRPEAKTRRQELQHQLKLLEGKVARLKERIERGW